MRVVRDVGRVRLVRLVRLVEIVRVVEVGRVVRGFGCANPASGVGVRGGGSREPPGP